MLPLRVFRCMLANRSLTFSKALLSHLSELQNHKNKQKKKHSLVSPPHLSLYLVLTHNQNSQEYMCLMPALSTHRLGVAGMTILHTQPEKAAYIERNQAPERLVEYLDPVSFPFLCNATRPLFFAFRSQANIPVVEKGTGTNAKNGVYTWFKLERLKDQEEVNRKVPNKEQRRLEEEVIKGY
jgi:hypothetical protein